MKLSILIPTLESRRQDRLALEFELNKQIHFCHDAINEVEILHDEDSGEKEIGRKRNDLLAAAKGDYICFFDDDDWPSSSYIQNIFEGIKKNADAISLLGVITWNGSNPEIFEHSINYPKYYTNNTGLGPKYERFPNHLNAIRASIAKQFRFPEKSFGEDYEWAQQIKDSYLIKTEHKVNEVIYHYRYTTDKK